MLGAPCFRLVRLTPTLVELDDSTARLLDSGGALPRDLTLVQGERLISGQQQGLGLLKPPLGHEACAQHALHLVPLPRFWCVLPAAVEALTEGCFGIGIPVLPKTKAAEQS